MKSTKTLVNTALVYALAGMAGGVFYREFTRFHVFEEQTTLSFVHTHLFLLGMCFFLLAAVIDRQFEVTRRRGFPAFYLLYNVGLLVTTGGLVWRGLVQVWGSELSIGMDSVISGVSGLGHILLGIGIILFFVLLKRQIAGVALRPADRPHPGTRASRRERKKPEDKKQDAGSVSDAPGAEDK